MTNTRLKLSCLKFDEMSTQIWDLNDFCIEDTGNDQLFGENKEFMGDQKMLEGYKYGELQFLKDSVFSHL